MRTVLGLTAAALALGSFAMPAHAGCVDDYLSGGTDYVMPRQTTVTSNPDGSYTVQPNNAVTDAKAFGLFPVGIALNEVRDLNDLVACVK